MESVVTVLQSQGPMAVALVVICYLFWNLTWKVWRTAMEAKEQEISRVTAERDKYQALVFENLLTSTPMAEGDPESDEDEKRQP